MQKQIKNHWTDLSATSDHFTHLAKYQLNIIFRKECVENHLALTALQINTSIVLNVQRIIEFLYLSEIVDATTLMPNKEFGDSRRLSTLPRSQRTWCSSLDLLNHHCGALSGLAGHHSGAEIQGAQNNL